MLPLVKHWSTKLIFVLAKEQRKENILINILFLSPDESATCFREKCIFLETLTKIPEPFEPVH